MLQEFIDAVETGVISLNIDRIFSLEEIVQAHEYMEANLVKGKIVVEV